jgi:hypothetical protein
MLVTEVAPDRVLRSIFGSQLLHRAARPLICPLFIQYHPRSLAAIILWAFSGAGSEPRSVASVPEMDRITQGH